MTARKASAPARTSGRRGSRVGEAVKPAPLDYVRAGSVEQAAGALAAADGDGKIIAGGQSPDDAVREVVFPAVTGGEQTLRELVYEFKTKGPVYRRTVQTTLRASYTGHYRRGLIALLRSACTVRSLGSPTPTRSWPRR